MSPRFSENAKFVLNGLDLLLAIVYERDVLDFLLEDFHLSLRGLQNCLLLLQSSFVRLNSLDLQVIFLNLKR